MGLENSIQYLKGVGEKRAKMYHKLGIFSISDLITHYPKEYENWSEIYTASNFPVDKTACLKAKVISEVTTNYVKKDMVIFTTLVSDGENIVKITFFNNKFVKDKLKVGKVYLFYGKLKFSFNKAEMTSPKFAETGKNIPLKPIYHLTQGLSNTMVENAVTQVVSIIQANPLNDIFDENAKKRFGLCSYSTALKYIHFPENYSQLEIARHTLSFHELFVFQIGLLKMGSRKSDTTSIVIKEDFTEEFYKSLPFSPTNAQKRCINECITDLKSTHPMSRLLQGDVGSGKTAVATAIAHTIIKNGYQAVLMAPTEILAQQHLLSISKILENQNICCCLLSGSVSKKEKNSIKEKILNGEIDFLIGTHALLEDDVVFKNLGLVITDEQHRFGVTQREKLNKKGNKPNILVMSATPIPRTLALMVYGDLDVSVIDELPSGRKPIETFAISTKKRERAYSYIKKFLDEGRQAYIVCPLIEESESDLISATQYFKKISETVFSDYSTGLLHGKMKPSEKDAVMNDFKACKTQILVSTTVIEVGVDVPNAVIMLIENAERFGLSQLHQLRGRIGRGKHKSTCILVSDAQNQVSIARLKTMTKTNDGFEIADEDLKLRGPGEFFGNKQHGLPEFKIANIQNDFQIFTLAQSYAKEILKEDFSLSTFPALKDKIETMIEKIKN